MALIWPVTAWPMWLRAKISCIKFTLHWFAVLQLVVICSALIGCNFFTANQKAQKWAWHKFMQKCFCSIWSIWLDYLFNIQPWSLVIFFRKLETPSVPFVRWNFLPCLAWSPTWSLPIRLRRRSLPVRSAQWNSSSIIGEDAASSEIFLIDNTSFYVITLWLFKFAPFLFWLF